MKNAISFSAVSLNRDGLAVLQDMTFTLEAGGSMVILGPSGSGKTTILHLLAGILKPDSGRILVEGRAALVFQNYGLFPWKTLSENITLGMPKSLLTKQEAKEQLALLLREFGLETMGHRYPAEASGGQCQRAALARALAAQPDILLLDEPGSALDDEARYKFHDLLINVRARRQCSILMVSHHREDAIFMGERILVLKAAESHRIIDNNGAAQHGWRDSPEAKKMVLDL